VITVGQTAIDKKITVKIREILLTGFPLFFIFTLLRRSLHDNTYLRTTQCITAVKLKIKIIANAQTVVIKDIFRLLSIHPPFKMNADNTDTGISHISSRYTNISNTDNSHTIIMPLTSSHSRDYLPMISNKD